MMERRTATKAATQRVAIQQVRLITGNPRMGWKAVKKWIKRWRAK